MKYTLLLGSESKSRQKLLHDARIPFKTIGHSADESACDWNMPLKEVLTSITCSKMEHVVLPVGNEGDYSFVLTADTMGLDSKGNIHGKPISKEDAIEKIIALRGRGKVATAFCLDKKQFLNNFWQVQQRIVQVVETEYEFNIPNEWIEHYLQEVPDYMTISGAITIEGFGAQFLKSIRGSYTSIIGLPMFEVREALQALDFFN
ncbi:MAG: Maf family protein [Candidatus Babeliales bacterium]